MTSRTPNSFILFLKKVCADYQENKREDEGFTRLNAPKLAEMAAYHWSHMTDIEKRPYFEAARANQNPRVDRDENCASYVK
jgi:hypothetical protein